MYFDLSQVPAAEQTGRLMLLYVMSEFTVCGCYVKVYVYGMYVYVYVHVDVYDMLMRRFMHMFMRQRPDFEFC